MRKHYLPFLSDETKLLIEDKKAVSEEFVKSGNINLRKESNRLGKDIKKKIKVDEKQYFENIFGGGFESKNAWSMAKEIIGMNKNLSPTAIKLMNAKGEIELVRSPKKLAEAFNRFFMEKVRKLS